MEKPPVLNDIEAILKLSGIASGSPLPQWAKDRLCHSVAIDITNYYSDLTQQAKADTPREIFEAYDAYIESLGSDLNKLTQVIIKHEKEHKARIQAVKAKYIK